MQEQLVFGYCRDIEELLNEKIIPQGIFQLCLMYYLSTNFIFYIYYPSIKETKLKGRQMMISDLDKNARFKCSLDSTIKNTSGSLCCTDQLKLPQTIASKYFESVSASNSNNNRYNAVIASFSSIAHILTFDATKLQSKDAGTYFI